MAKYTPMIEQYLKIKEQAQDAFLFFRLGDFYEMFFDDAILASKELEITLTGREGGGDERIPMCGVPYHSAEGYIQRLIEKGYKVAICEQMEDASAVKGMVRREIVRVVTPGTIMDSKVVGDKSNNYMVCVTGTGGLYSLAACDLSTGELYVTSVPASEEWLRDEINLYEPSEMIGDADLLDVISGQMPPGGRAVVYTPWERREDELVKSQFGEAAWARLEEERRICVSLLISYLSETQKRSLGQLTEISSYEPGQYMVLDPFTRRNLELVETVRERSKKGSLLWLLDRTETSMGARLLRRRIDKPLLSKSRIEERLEAVEYLYHQYILREDLRGALKEIYDLERLVGRIAFGSANGRDMNALKLSLGQVPGIKEMCGTAGSATLRRLAAEMDACEDLRELIEEAIVDDPPVSVRDGGIIKPGFHERLDELREASTNGKRWIAELEARERAETGIKSLKIGYNKVFGYFIEVTKSNLSSLPEGRYERKQTLANAERFVTPELKEKESLILEAQEKMVDLEYALFTELRDKLNTQVSRLQKLAEKIAEIDVYQSLAAVSAEHRFVKPELSEGYDLIVDGGRHPVVEAVMKDTSFVANGTELRKDGSSILLITGPNMAGKSTYMRQVALLSILAQIGCFVPAERAVIPMVDRIFTRIGAADDLIGGQSTFMVEMADIQVMTDKATPRSLIIIDELGRGTSTSEGMAIAQAVIEYVHDHIGCKALVSTHFHELAHLQESLSGLRNFSMAVQESGDKVHFLRKLIPGAADSSYGIYCARLAGLPHSIIERAYGLLQGLEQVSLLAVGAGQGAAAAAGGLPGDGSPRPHETGGAAPLKELPRSEPEAQADEAVAIASGTAEAAAERGPVPGEVIQLSIFDEADTAAAEHADARRQTAAAAEAAAFDPQVKGIIDAVKGADVMNMTPLQAMQLLNELKQKARDL
ncbi:DNA mismatch repair protein MutS [Paenibacillus cisolokensis]|uniref:DNA mismatch repair protein MutS n=1 Tax=Paenibacillus cisolokensis TaxID=1658519 RepID=UPI003D28AA38